MLKAMSWTTLCALDELQEGQGKPIDVDGYRLSVFLDAGVPYVLSNVCPHAGAPMSEGWITNGCAVCPRHNWAFNLRDGTLVGSGGEGLSVYASRVFDHNGRRFVQAELPMP